MSRCAGDGLVIVRTAITPGREGLFGSVFEVSGARNPGVRAAGNRGSVASGRSLPRPANPAPRYDCPPAVPRPAAVQRNPAGLAGHSCLRGASGLLGCRGPLPPVYRGQGPLHLQPEWGGRPRSPRGRPAEARRATHGTSGTKAPATTDARAEGGSGAAQGRGSDPRERSGAGARVGSRGAGRIRGRDRQEAGSPRAGPGATGFGWAPPYLRSRLA